MIDVSPRPLARLRLEKLVHGLRERLSGSAEKMMAEVSVLSDRMTDLQSEHDREWISLQSSQQRELEGSTTAWDEALQRRWDDAEMRSFKAVYDTAQRESMLRRATRTAVEETTAEAKRRAAELEQQFLRAKDGPVKRLNAYRTEVAQQWEQLLRIEQAAEAVLAQRSLSIPSSTADDSASEQPPNSADALQALRNAVASAQSSAERLANPPVAKFFESPAWWGICGLTFLLVTALLWLSSLAQPLVAALIAAVLTVSMILVSLIGMRPWLKTFAATEYPHLKRSVQLGGVLRDTANQLAVQENDAELKRLAAKRDEQFEHLKQWRQQHIDSLTQTLEKNIQELLSSAASEKQLASQQLTKALDEANASFRQRLQREQQAAENRRQALLGQLTSNRNDIRSRIDELNRGGALRLQIATQKAMQIISRSRRWCNEYFPDWQRLGEQLAWPENLREPVFPIGSLPIANLLPEPQKQDVAESQLRAPVLFSPLEDRYLTITGDPSQAAIGELVRNLIMRGLTTLLPGKLHTCVIDPPGLGRDFGWLMHLGDFDPQLVSHRVWTQTGHIAKQLADLATIAEDFIQQSLRNRYRDIAEFNRDAGALAEPYRLLTWSSFPSGLDEHSWRSLNSLLDTGARCGIIPILIIDPRIAWPKPEWRDAIFSRGFHVVYDEDAKGLRIPQPAFNDLLVQVPPAADGELAQQIVVEVGRRALQTSRVEVPLAGMLPEPEQVWQADSSAALEIPVGQSGVGRVHSLKLGVGTAQHAIIAGKTGSGKSSLLHAIITSACLKYSPQRLRLVLLDFKKGVEFQVYAEAGLPHADIIGIESEREFGLSALQYIDACMQRRGEMFRKVGAQDIATWNTRNPEQVMPRILLVVDEFQELFVEEDKLASSASQILDRIVRQGRSFGVHAILSSQTLAGAYSLPRTTLGQIAVRIALQCDASDAQIIFSEDNPAAARLKIPGQAVYNDAGGRIEGNQPMQIGWLTQLEQVQRLQQLPAEGYRNQDASTNQLGRCVIYDGNRAASWNAEQAEMAIHQAAREVNPNAIWGLVGESVAIHPAVVFPLTQQAGRNMLLVGADDASAAAVMTAIAASFTKATKSQGPTIFIAQGAKPTDANALQLPKLWQQLESQIHVADIRGVEILVRQVHQTLIDRRENVAGQLPVETPHSPILLVLVQLGRMRELRRGDEFSLDSFDNAELAADKLLEEILRDGPSHGIYTLVWTENHSTAQRWLSRNALREIEIRLLMQMSATDSTNFIDSVAASRLGDHIMLLYDEATGQEQKFRPFASSDLNHMTAWAGTGPSA